MEFTWSDYFAATMVLFAVIDVVGSIPIIVDVKRKAGQISSFRATMVSAFIMLAFLFLGEKLITFLGIDVNSFAVAGSLVLFFLALEMVLGVEFFKHDPKAVKAASIVPIAFPIIAGAGSMTTIISLRAEYSQLVMILAIFTNMIVVYFVLRSIYKIEKMLGDTGIAILRKAFGIILLAIAVKLFSANVTQLF
ncbi:MAG: MarC family protein [Flavobacteriales bacterium]|jgi:multiple antibiotic resistance protein|nr:MarC family protein [Flavobacteriales bacterium]